MGDVISVDSLVKKALRTFSVSTSAGDFALRPSGEKLIVDQIRDSVHSLLISKLPEKKPVESTWVLLPSGQHVQDKDTANWYNGFNQAIDNMHKSIDELFGVNHE